jgi:hypothetical protein
MWKGNKENTYFAFCRISRLHNKCEMTDTCIVAYFWYQERGPMDYLMKKESKKGAEPNQVTLYQKTLRRYPVDLVYTSLFNKTLWQCPGTVNPDEDDGPSSRLCK